MNKLVEREAFIDSMKVRIAELNNKFLFEVSLFFFSLGGGEDRRLLYCG